MIGMPFPEAQISALMSRINDDDLANTAPGFWAAGSRAAHFPPHFFVILGVAFYLSTHQSICLFAGAALGGQCPALLQHFLSSRELAEDFFEVNSSASGTGQTVWRVGAVKAWLSG